MMRRPLLALIAAAVVACGALAAGCGDDDATPAGDAENVELILDWFPNADHAGIFGAVAQGYFADEGLDVKPTVPSDPAAALKQVGTGRAAFAVSYEPEVLIARSQGVPVVAVGALVTHPLNSVLVRDDRGITRPRDLEGKTVGAAGVPSDRPLLDAVVRSDGGDPSKVAMRNIGFTLAPALAAGRVDAVIGAYWNIEQVELDGQGVKVSALRLEQHGVPDYDELVVVTNDEIVRDRPDLVRAFLRGLRSGQDWAATDETGAVDHLLDANPDLVRDTLVEQMKLTAPLLSPSDEPTLSVDPADWEAYARWMRDNGLLTKPFDASDAVTAAFLPEAR